MIYYTGFTEQKARLLSGLCHRLTRPESLAIQEGDVSAFSFGVLKHPQNDEWAIELPEDYHINKHLNINSEITEGVALSDFASAYEGLANEEERNSFLYYVYNNSVIYISNLIPSGLTPRDRQYMETNGWFNE